MKRTLPVILVLFFVLPVSGCSGPRGMILRDPTNENLSYVENSRILDLPPVVIYQDQAGPASFQPAVLSEYPGGKIGRVIDVRGESCQQGIAIPIIGGFSISFGWDDGSYDAALQDAMKSYMVEQLFDVRADIRRLNVIGVYQKLCVIVNAKGIRPPNL